MKRIFLRRSPFYLPFGRHKGQTLEQVGATPEGLDYLRWTLAEMSARPARASVARAIREYLEQREARC